MPPRHMGHAGSRRRSAKFAAAIHLRVIGLNSRVAPITLVWSWLMTGGIHRNLLPRVVLAAETCPHGWPMAVVNPAWPVGLVTCGEQHYRDRECSYHRVR